VVSSSQRGTVSGVLEGNPAPGYARVMCALMSRMWRGGAGGAREYSVPVYMRKTKNTSREGSNRVKGSSVICCNNGGTSNVRCTAISNISNIGKEQCPI
jgi:hypothetical protein